MLKIFATFAFGMLGASAAPPLETAMQPFGPHGPVALVFANGDAGTQAQRTDGGRPQAASNPTSAKQHLRKASKAETNDGFCECSDERVRAHCLIYMKLRGDRS